VLAASATWRHGVMTTSIAAAATERMTRSIGRYDYAKTWSTLFYCIFILRRQFTWCVQSCNAQINPTLCVVCCEESELQGMSIALLRPCYLLLRHQVHWSSFSSAERVV